MLKLYSTLDKKIKKFKPLLKTKVKMYTCGPTVYDFAHIGNLRSMITADILKRTLEYNGYKIKHIKNITDVGHLTTESQTGEDKVLKRACLEKKTPEEIANFFTAAFLKDEKKLNIIPADYFPKASDHINEMIKLIKILIKKGYAYATGGNVYFETAKFKKYGQLSGNTLKNLKAGARVEKDNHKKSAFDFALWRKAPDNYLMKWPSPWGIGFPGWHIECSAMSKKYLGKTFDIHTGGEDNIFPHHEDEIAQSEAANSVGPVNFWLHTRWLLVNSEKMSKSEGNFFTLPALEKRGFKPLAFRLLCLSTHWRHQLNFTLQALADADRALNKLTKFIVRIKPAKLKNHTLASDKIQSKIVLTKSRFDQAINYNLDTAGAVGVVFDFIKKIKFFKFLFTRDRQAIYQTMLDFDRILGLGLDKIKKPTTKLDLEAKKLIRKRKQLRRLGDFTKADKIRLKLEKLGVKVEDEKLIQINQ